LIGSATDGFAGGLGSPAGGGALPLTLPVSIRCLAMRPSTFTPTPSLRPVPS
jgi:hypothetical protein